LPSPRLPCRPRARCNYRKPTPRCTFRAFPRSGRQCCVGVRTSRISRSVRSRDILEGRYSGGVGLLGRSCSAHYRRVDDQRASLKGNRIRSVLQSHSASECYATRHEKRIGERRTLEDPRTALAAWEIGCGTVGPPAGDACATGRKDGCGTNCTESCSTVRARLTV
jgi:hypothetical protein